MIALTLAADMGLLDWIAAVATAGCGLWLVVGAVLALIGYKQVLKPLASLKLTVVLFALAIVLIFVGTLAQVDSGIWTVLREYFRTWVARVELQGFIRFGQTFFHVSPSAHTDATLPFPGGYLIGWLMMFNLLAAHLVRFKLTWQRAGIFVLHAGIILMLVGELITALMANESNMSIAEGQTVKFSEDIRTAEIAIVDASDPKVDHVTVVPRHLLRDGQTVSDAALPFDIEIVEYMPNSDVHGVGRGGHDDENPATAGMGLMQVAHRMKEYSGVADADKNDIPSIYVTLKDKETQKPIGTYLLSVFFTFSDMPEVVKVGDKTYDLYLRFERTYYPFSMKLLKFDHGYYPGTRIARNFESNLQLVDPERSENREVHISMNSPLRYAGLTFFQHQFTAGGRGTVLQVVRNPGWLLPYISCVVVAMGMLIHFGIVLTRFARRSQA